MGTEVVIAWMRSATAWLADRGGRQGSRPTALNSAGPLPAERVRQPNRPRSFDPSRIADLEYRAWVGYYLGKWPQVLAALAGLVREGFGTDWYRTLYGAWLLLRASQLWAPIPDNDPDGARACLGGSRPGQAQLRRACQPGQSRRARGRLVARAPAGPVSDSAEGRR